MTGLIGEKLESHMKQPFIGVLGLELCVCLQLLQEDCSFFLYITFWSGLCDYLEQLRARADLHDLFENVSPHMQYT